jgi:hypothetical protein
MRLPGDALFIVGILPLLYLTWQAVRHGVAPVVRGEQREVLFAEVVEPGGAGK